MSDPTSEFEKLKRLIEANIREADRSRQLIEELRDCLGHKKSASQKKSSQPTSKIVELPSPDNSETDSQTSPDYKKMAG